jgi:hypothetical protein
MFWNLINSLMEEWKNNCSKKTNNLYLLGTTTLLRSNHWVLRFSRLKISLSLNLNLKQYNKDVL